MTKHKDKFFKEIFREERDSYDKKIVKIALLQARFKGIQSERKRINEIMNKIEDKPHFDFDVYWGWKILKQEINNEKLK